MTMTLDDALKEIERLREINKELCNISNTYNTLTAGQENRIRDKQNRIYDLMDEVADLKAKLSAYEEFFGRF